MPCLSRDRVTAAVAVDHVVPKAQGGTDDLENLQSICQECHDIKTQAEKGARLKLGCDATGTPADPDHPWNADDSQSLSSRRCMGGGG